MAATPDAIWRVLADPLWVVGASRVRDVDETWPDLGSGKLVPRPVRAPVLRWHHGESLLRRLSWLAERRA